MDRHARRYERASFIVTSNKGFLDWGEIFQDHVLATAILDRLLHHATTLNIKGESYRLKEKRRAGLLGQTPPTPTRGGGHGRIAAPAYRGQNRRRSGDTHVGVQRTFRIGVDNEAPGNGASRGQVSPFPLEPRDGGVGNFVFVSYT